MAKQIHTHRGHCQLCASVQAINTQTGAIAEHGYTRAGGYFSGSCPGSQAMNLHVSRATADARIFEARAEAVRCDATAFNYRTGVATPVYAWNGEYRLAAQLVGGRPVIDKTRDSYAMYCRLTQEEVIVRWELAPAEFQAISLERAIDSLTDRAKTCRDYADNLQKWADKITGKVDPYQAADLEPRDWEVDDVVRIGGKKGYDATVEAVAMQPYTTFGLRTGRSTVDCKHVQVTRPAVTEKRVSEKAGGYVIREARPAKVLWVAMRDIKDRKPNPLADELKAAGLL